MAMHFRHAQLVACLLWPAPGGGSTFAWWRQGPQSRRLAARANETGLTKNTKIPWGASQGILVPCVTTSGPHA
jgi:hypothetical protein